jgi:hypothetical protein
MTGYGATEWTEEIKPQLNCLPKDVGFEDIWEEQVETRTAWKEGKYWEDKNNEDGNSNP